MKKILGFLLVFLLSTTLFAHEDWIDVSNYYPAVGDTISIYLAAGHHYPESEILLAERLIYQPEIITPNGTAVPLKFSAEKNQWKTTYIVKSPGVYVIKYALKKPPLTDPLFYGKALVIAGEKDQGKKYSTGSVMEISPTGEISDLAKGDTLAFQLLQDSKPVKGTILLMPAGGKDHYLSTTPDQPAKYTLEKPGKYLVYTEQGGTNCSVTFAIKR